VNTTCLPTERVATCLYRATGNQSLCLQCELPDCIEDFIGDTPPVAAPVEWIHCVTCDILFRPFNRHHTHCSPYCYNQAYKKERGLFKCGDLSAHIKNCPQCGLRFSSHIPPSGGRHTVYCSPECRIRWQNREGRQARKRQAKGYNSRELSHGIIVGGR
jgi:hypothetical protein